MRSRIVRCRVGAGWRASPEIEQEGPPARISAAAAAAPALWVGPGGVRAIITGMTGLPARLSVVTIGARDVPSLRRFYGRLGWPEVPGGDDAWVGFLLGGVLLALYPCDALAAEAAPDRPQADGFSGITLACNVDSEEHVDAAFEAAVAAGATPVAEPVARDWGGRSAYIADPEGNRWEIAWAPGAVFDERGAVVAFG